MIEFRSVYDDERFVLELYTLLCERPPEANISHKELPSLQDHAKFVASRPYAAWYMILAEGTEIVGAIYATPRNELGIAIFKAHRRQGYARLAIRKFINDFKPLPATPSVRQGRWIANISPENEISKELFKSIGFKHIQETYAL